MFINFTVTHSLSKEIILGTRRLQEEPSSEAETEHMASLQNYVLRPAKIFTPYNYFTRGPERSQSLLIWNLNYTIAQ